MPRSRFLQGPSRPGTASFAFRQSRALILHLVTEPQRSIIA